MKNEESKSIAPEPSPLGSHEPTNTPSGSMKSRLGVWAYLAVGEPG